MGSVPTATITTTTTTRFLYLWWEKPSHFIDTHGLNPNFSGTYRRAKHWRLSGRWMYFRRVNLIEHKIKNDYEPVKVVWNKPSPEQQHVKNPFTVFTSTCTELSKQSTQSLSTKIVSPGCSFYSRINQNKRKR